MDEDPAAVRVARERCPALQAADGVGAAMSVSPSHHQIDTIRRTPDRSPSPLRVTSARGSCLDPHSIMPRSDRADGGAASVGEATALADPVGAALPGDDVGSGLFRRERSSSAQTIRNERSRRSTSAGKTLGTGVSVCTWLPIFREKRAYMSHVLPFPGSSPPHSDTPCWP